jgi:flagellar capping protein FliD
MSYRNQLKQRIENLEKQIAESKTKNLELENELLRLKFNEMEEEMREDNHRKSLLQG